MTTNQHRCFLRPRSLLAALTTVLLVTITVPSSKAQASLDFLEGASIVAHDGQFLGVISQNKVRSDSISNEVGKYGSSVSSTSIFNPVCQYGSEVSSLSPFNSVTSTPPKIFTQDNKWAYLTTNESLSPRINPYAVIGWAKR
jgi:hypothetical protein